MNYKRLNLRQFRGVYPDIACYTVNAGVDSGCAWAGSIAGVGFGEEGVALGVGKDGVGDAMGRVDYGKGGGGGVVG